MDPLIGTLIDPLSPKPLNPKTLNPITPKPPEQEEVWESPMRSPAARLRGADEEPLLGFKGSFKGIYKGSFKGIYRV